MDETLSYLPLRTFRIAFNLIRVFVGKKCLCTAVTCHDYHTTADTAQGTPTDRWGCGSDDVWGREDHIVRG